MKVPFGGQLLKVTTIYSFVCHSSFYSNFSFLIKKGHNLAVKLFLALRPEVDYKRHPRGGDTHSPREKALDQKNLDLVEVFDRYIANPTATRFELQAELGLHRGISFFFFLPLLMAALLTDS